MKVNRIVANVATSDVDKARAFYTEILGLEVLMDLGWIRTYGSSSQMTVQVSVMSEGAADASTSSQPGPPPVPRRSTGVDGTTPRTAP